jgi:predicted DsbA family dithiol-disulfide isomerase
VGWTAPQIVAFLESSELDDVVFARYREALELGINGVPYFVISVGASSLSRHRRR